MIKDILANGLWIGDIPTELEILSLPERLLIALYFPAAYIVKLFPKSGAGTYNPHALNKGLRGNVSTYPLDANGLAKYITSNSLPHDPRILAAILGITFMSPNGRPERTLPQIFWVNQKRIRDALCWLKLNNHLYANIEISEENLARLPENGIPIELNAIARISSDMNAITREHESYIPTPLVDEEVSEESDMIDLPHAGLISIGDKDEPLGMDTEHDPKIVPIQAHGVIDITGSEIPDSELMANALARLGKSKKEDIQVWRGSKYINEYPRMNEEGTQRTDGGSENPNHLLGAFPWLYPYGRGGFETQRPVDIPYHLQARWSLQIDCSRFRKEHHFVFMVFGVQIKRQIAASSVLQIGRGSYQKHQNEIQRLTPRDLLQASEEERKGQKFSNPTVQRLRTQITTIRSRVMGTDESRREIRSQIWGTVAMCGPPTFWLTINPSDIHDPVAQVLAGERIDLDAFCATAGPDASTRAMNIANDPFAAAEFFHYSVIVILRDVMGIDAHRNSNRHEIKRQEGVLGMIKAYVGTVEAQGRGTLHLHILLWGEGGPTSENMAFALQSPEFKNKVREFIGQSMHAHLPGLTAEEITALPSRGSASYSRPLHPHSVEYNQQNKKQTEILARTLQLHSCKGKGCLVSRNGKVKCKRRAPFDISEAPWINSNGEWGPKRNHAYLVTWNPTLLTLLRCNHNLQLLTNSGVTRKLVWYLTLYATKKQQVSSNASALLAKVFAYNNEKTISARNTEPMDKANKQLIQRCANSLNRDQEFSAPEVISYLMGWGDRYISHKYVKIYWGAVSWRIAQIIKYINQNRNEDVNEESENATATLHVEDGRLEIHDQFLELGDLQAEEETFNQRFMQFIEQADERTRKILDNLNYFYESSDEAQADAEGPVYGQAAREEGSEHGEYNDEEDGQQVRGHGEAPDFVVEATEAEIERRRREAENFNERQYGEEALEIAFQRGVFSDEEGLRNFHWQNDARSPGEVEKQRMLEWSKAIEDAKVRTAQGMEDVVPEKSGGRMTIEASIRFRGETFEGEDEEHDEPRITRVPHVEQGCTTDPDTKEAYEGLNTEQQRALKVIHEHVNKNEEGDENNFEQLLMQVNGCGGTGKTRLIDAITQLFALLGKSEQLSKTATAGVPASRIGGCTIHWWAGINGRGAPSDRPSKTIVDRRKRNIGPTKYLIIDEYSMMTKEFLADLSMICGGIKSNLGINRSKEAFGGINIILFGDLHQFPPVSKPKSALYCRVNRDTRQDLGRELFERFETCIILDQQMRVQDQGWNEMLNRLRTGSCTAGDVDMIDELVLEGGGAQANETDFTGPGWKDAILITPRHSVRKRWNAAALRKFSSETGRCIYVSPAHDRHNPSGRRLTNNERAEVAGRRGKETEGLEEFVEICVGMKAMIQSNIATELNMSNGTRGTVTGIILDGREPVHRATENGVIHLQYPPACVMFKPEEGRGIQLNGLQADELPIFPMEAKFELTNEAGETTKVRRKQTPLTAASVQIKGKEHNTSTTKGLSFKFYLRVLVDNAFTIHNPVSNGFGITDMASATACDIIMAIAMVCYLSKGRTEFPTRIQSLINKLIFYFVGIGALTSIFALLVLILWLALPHNLIFLIFHSVISKLYANSFLPQFTPFVTR
ncbi:hypothetical protein ONZ45_g10073 [Pleurotus djamor]|nr:hypothetical protein ONZ45_g10073 [Pleurotus djamor]